MDIIGQYINTIALFFTHIRPMGSQKIHIFAVKTSYFANETLIGIKIYPTLYLSTSYCIDNGSGSFFYQQVIYNSWLTCNFITKSIKIASFSFNFSVLCIFNITRLYFACSAPLHFLDAFFLVTLAPADRICSLGKFFGQNLPPTQFLSKSVISSRHAP